MSGSTVSNVPISYIHTKNELISILNVEYARTFVSNEWIRFDTECPHSTICPFHAKIKEKKLYLFASEKVDLGVMQLIRITAKECLAYIFNLSLRLQKVIECPTGFKKENGSGPAICTRISIVNEILVSQI